MTTPKEMRDREKFFRDIEEREGIKILPLFNSQKPLEEEEMREFLEHIKEVEIRRIERRTFNESMERKMRELRKYKIARDVFGILFFSHAFMVIAMCIYVLFF